MWQIIIIPFLGTSLGAACVFLFKDSIGDGMQRALNGFASGVMVAASFFSLILPALDLTEDMGAEQKARTTYDNILRLSDDPDVNDVIRFLREREVVHYQRFGEALRLATEKLDQKNIYAMNPAFDR